MTERQVRCDSCQEMVTYVKLVTVGDFAGGYETYYYCTDCYY